MDKSNRTMIQQIAKTTGSANWVMGGEDIVRLFADYQERYEPENVRRSPRQNDPEVDIKHLNGLLPAGIDVETMRTSGMTLEQARRLLSDLGVTGTVSLRTCAKNGRKYFIFKGNQKFRSLIRGTRYRFNNARLIKLGVGEQGARNSLKGGLVISLVIIGSIDVVEYFLNDRQTLGNLLAGLSTDAVKICTATALGTVVAGKMAALGTAGVAALSIPAVPLIIGVVVAVGASYVLQVVDENPGITDALAQALDEAVDGIKKTGSELRRGIRWRICPFPIRGLGW